MSLAVSSNARDSLVGFLFFCTTLHLLYHPSFSRIGDPASVLVMSRLLTQEFLPELRVA